MKGWEGRKRKDIEGKVGRGKILIGRECRKIKDIEGPEGRERKYIEGKVERTWILKGREDMKRENIEGKGRKKEERY